MDRSTCCRDISEILLEMVLNTMQSINNYCVYLNTFEMDK